MHHHNRILSPPQPLLFPCKEVGHIPYNSFKLKHKIKLIDTNYKVQILSRLPLPLDTYRPGILEFIMAIATLHPESQLDSDIHTNDPCTYLSKNCISARPRCSEHLYRTHTAIVRPPL